MTTLGSAGAAIYAPLLLWEELLAFPQKTFAFANYNIQQGTQAILRSSADQSEDLLPKKGWLSTSLRSSVEATAWKIVALWYQMKTGGKNQSQGQKFCWNNADTLWKPVPNTKLRWDFIGRILCELLWELLDIRKQDIIKHSVYHQT